MRDTWNRIRDLFSNPPVTTFCPVCETERISFSPLPDFYRQQALGNGFVHFGCGEMTAHETYTCDNCGASDRERLYALWIDQQVRNNVFPKGTPTVHFAPEAALSRKIRNMNHFNYLTADLLMDDVDHKVDMMDLPFDDGSFGFFICSHVLEHVESDDRAIDELFRITKRGGLGILMAPIIVGLEKTLEDPSVTDEAGRWRNFGQGDHVRLYAHDDYLRKIRHHGFRVDELGERRFGTRVFRSLGLKPTSVLYIVSK